MPVQLGVKWSIANFLDSPRVAKYLEAGERRSLNKFGGYIRRVARNSLKYADGPAGSGQPPHVHQKFIKQKKSRKTGLFTAQAVSPLRELLFYSYDPGRQSVVVGPAIFPSTAKSVQSSRPVPGTLERGGMVQIVREVPVRTGPGRSAGPRQKEEFLRHIREGTLQSRRQTQTVVESRQYRPHPFMKPSYEVSLPRFSSYFANLTGGGAGADV